MYVETRISNEPRLVFVCVFCLVCFVFVLSCVFFFWVCFCFVFCLVLRLMLWKLPFWYLEKKMGLPLFVWMEIKINSMILLLIPMNDLGSLMCVCVCVCVCVYLVFLTLWGPNVHFGHFIWSPWGKQLINHIKSACVYLFIYFYLFELVHWLCEGSLWDGGCFQSKVWFSWLLWI